MKKSSLFNPNACLVLALALTVGCAPAPDRTPTDVGSAGDVTIDVGEEAPPEEPSEDMPVDEAPAIPDSKPVVQEEPAADKPEMKAEPVAKADKPVAPKEESKPETPKEESKPAADPNAGYTGPPKFTGRVVVKGMPPELAPKVKKGQNVKDAVCAENDVPDESVVTGEGGGLAHVFVYMRRAPKGDVPGPEGDIPVLDQKGCIYMPHAMVARVGQPLHMKNSDPVAHNVHITGFTNNFNQTVPANDQEGIKYEFSGTERQPIPVTCDFHGWMQSWVLPIDHPWATVTDKDGNFAIENLPSGEHQFVIWHEKIGFIEKSFDVTAAKDKVFTHEFSVDASKLSQ
ncbi:MAG: hypothetical protein KDA80_10460 [Planctomycetaceae bacterium]|nr:hypothetical protein [Planctomycetaceae bacterium]